LISPPTPPQLEADKAAIDAEFSKAFALIDQLSQDTTSLKEAEDARNTRLDSAIGEIEAVLADLKQANADREKQARRTNDDIAALRERIPAALQGWKTEHERRLGEVGQELRSLKMLVGNRVGVQAAGGNLARPAVGGAGSSVSPNTTKAGGSDAGADSISISVTDPVASPPPPLSADAAAPSFKGPDGKPGFSFEGSESGSTSGGRNKRAIPAWQLAASGGSAENQE
jgi:peroxin-14